MGCGPALLPRCSSGLATKAAFSPEAGRGGRLQAGLGAGGIVPAESAAGGKICSQAERWRPGLGDGRCVWASVPAAHTRGLA